jgi:hypothetical protein
VFSKETARHKRERFSIGQHKSTNNKKETMKKEAQEEVEEEEKDERVGQREKEKQIGRTYRFDRMIEIDLLMIGDKSNNNE